MHLLGKEKKPIWTGTGHSAWVRTVAWNPTETFVASGADVELRDVTGRSARSAVRTLPVPPRLRARLEEAVQAAG